MITKNEITKSLNQVIKQKDEIVVIYSDFSKFLDKFEKHDDLISEILDLIENFITKNRTLILPSFSANIFLRTGKFDLKNSIDNIGVLPKEALKRNYFRTPQPLHSYLVLGKKVNEIKKLSFQTSWGKGSILDFMFKNNARICTIGLPWNKGCAYLHKFEEDYQVPWRYFKKYQGKMYFKKKFLSKCEEIKYSLPKMNCELYNYKPFIKKIKNSQSFCKNDNKEFKIESVKSSCIDKIARKIYLNDPWCIITKKRKLINWIKNERVNDVILNK
jgi:aminoglycoside N3'-acetyltransferase